MRKDEPEEATRVAERREPPSAMHVVGVATVVLCALTLYFAAIAMYLGGTASSAIDHALTSAVRIALGACAISALVSGAFFLTWKDQAVMRAQQGGQDARRTGD